MEKKEELLACFRKEINDISEAEIKKLHQEMDAIRESSERELREAAKEQIDRWYEQEAQELTSQHAIAMSHLYDEHHHKLMQERSALVDGLFEEVKKQLLLYRETADYQNSLKEKVRKYAKDVKKAVLQVAEQDKALLQELLEELDSSCNGEVVSDILFGGFRLVAESQGKVIDETYDSALAEERVHFLQTSGLTIE